MIDPGGAVLGSTSTVEPVAEKAKDFAGGICAKPETADRVDDKVDLSPDAR